MDDEAKAAAIDEARKRYSILQYFQYDHLPEKLRAVSKPFGDLAFEMALALPFNPETSAGLRKLLEAKDCLVRAALSAL